MSRRDEPPVVLSGRVVATTDKAVLVRVGNLEAWLPKSQVEALEDAVRDEEIEFECPAWLARDKGFDEG